MDSATGDAWGLVLAGGDGTRLQALTRLLTGGPTPKQYCRIIGDRSLLETTLDRIRPLFPPNRTLVVVNHDHLAVAGDQLGTLPPDNVLVQPSNRGTGPGLLFALLRLARRHPGAVVAVFPSDHYVRDERAFLSHVERAARIVRQVPEKVVLLGLRPDRPEPGLGYIEPAGPVGLPGTGAAFHVAAFHEKPSAEAAARIVARGGLWNSFVMVFTVERMLALLRETCPDHYAGMERGAAAYRTLPSWDFSHHFLTRIPRNLIALRVEDVGWSDWGTPEAIERTLTLLDLEPPWRARLDSTVAA
jgi:mannose-1-phosphate guanylyltransferase